MSESETDIYEDLPEFKYDNKLDELQSIVNTLIEKNDSLYARLLQMSKEKEDFQEKCNVLSVNISILLKTAQAEIVRKDRTIKDLRQELEASRKRLRNGEKFYIRQNKQSSQIVNKVGIDNRSSENNPKEILNIKDNSSEREFEEQARKLICAKRRSTNFSPISAGIKEYKSKSMEGPPYHSSVHNNKACDKKRVILRDQCNTKESPINIRDNFDTLRNKQDMDLHQEQQVSRKSSGTIKCNVSRNDEEHRRSGKSISPIIQSTGNKLKDFTQNRNISPCNTMNINNNLQEIVNDNVSSVHITGILHNSLRNVTTDRLNPNVSFAQIKIASKKNELPTEKRIEIDTGKNNLDKIFPAPTLQKGQFKTVFSERMAKRNELLAQIETNKASEVEVSPHAQVDDKSKHFEVTNADRKEEHRNVKSDQNRDEEEVVKNNKNPRSHSMKLTRTRCAINPISNSCNLNKTIHQPPRIVTRSQVSLQPPEKKVKAQPIKPRKQMIPNKCTNSMLLDIFGSPVKWVDSSSSEDESVPQIDLSSPALYEDSCSAQIENCQFAEKSKTIVALNNESCIHAVVSKKEQTVRINEGNKRPFQNLSKDNPKSLFSPEKSGFDPSLQLAPSISLPPLVFEPCKPIPPINPKYEDTFMGQFEDTTQFITALTKVENQISPMNTPPKSNEPKGSLNKISPLTIQQPTIEYKENNTNSSDKPINILKPRKTPRIVTKTISNNIPINKTFSLKDSFVLEQEKKVMNLKNTESEKVLQVFGSCQSSENDRKAPIEKMKWVLKPLELQPKTTRRRESMNLESGSSPENKNEKDVTNNFTSEMHDSKFINKVDTELIHSAILFSSLLSCENSDIRKNGIKSVSEDKNTLLPPKHFNSLSTKGPDNNTKLETKPPDISTDITDYESKSTECRTLFCNQVIGRYKLRKLEIGSNIKLPFQNGPVKHIRNNRKITWTNVDNPGKLIVTKCRPINFSVTNL